MRHGFVTACTTLIATSLLLLASCDRSDAKPDAATPAATPANDVVVRLGYFANLTHAQAVLGVASGDVAKAIAPAKLETKIFNAGPSLVEALFAGEVDIGYVGPGPAIAGYAARGDKGLRVISGAAANGVIIVARAESGIKSLADLAGKRLATPQLANTQDIAARHYLSAELKLNELTNVMPIANAEQVQMMQRGEIDAAWVPEPWGTRLINEVKAQLVADEKDLWPEKQFAITLVVVSPEFLDAHPELVSKFLGVHRQWTAKLQADPAGQLPDLKKALFALTNKKLPEGTLEQAITRVKYTDDPLFPTIQTMASWTYELGFAKQPPKLDGMIVNPGAPKGQEK